MCAYGTNISSANKIKQKFERIASKTFQDKPDYRPRKKQRYPKSFTATA